MSKPCFFIVSSVGWHPGMVGNTWGTKLTFKNTYFEKKLEQVNFPLKTTTKRRSSKTQLVSSNSQLFTS